MDRPTSVPWAAPAVPDAPADAAPPPPDPEREADSTMRYDVAPVAFPKAGQLVVAWQIMLGLTWTAAFFAFAATWKASEEIGIGTWWLGPRADPQPVAVKIIPFAVCVFFAMLAIYNVRRVASLSAAGSLVVAAIAVVDIERSGGLALIEFAIAGAVLLVSLGALTGTYRIAPAAGPPPAQPDAPF